MSIDAEIFHGDLPLELEGLEESDAPIGELDSLSVELLVNWATRKAECTELGYTKGAVIEGYDSMFVEDIRYRKSGQLCTAQIQGVGLLEAGDKRRRRLSCAGQQISVGPIERVVLSWVDGEKGEDDGVELEKVKRRTPKLDEEGEVIYKSIVTPSGAFDRWNIAQAILTVQDTYFTTVKPDESIAGTANTPPNAPTPPPYIWETYGEPMRAQHPNGWVIDDRAVDPLFEPVGGGPGLWAVTDSWGYYYPALPD